jgi:hypothetical protein
MPFNTFFLNIYEAASPDTIGNGNVFESALNGFRVRIPFLPCPSTAKLYECSYFPANEVDEFLSGFQPGETLLIFSNVSIDEKNMEDLTQLKSREQFIQRQN